MISSSETDIRSRPPQILRNSRSHRKPTIRAYKGYGRFRPGLHLTYQTFLGEFWHDKLFKNRTELYLAQTFRINKLYLFDLRRRLRTAPHVHHVDVHLDFHSRVKGRIVFERSEKRMRDHVNT